MPNKFPYTSTPVSMNVLAIKFNHIILRWNKTPQNEGCAKTKKYQDWDKKNPALKGWQPRIANMSSDSPLSCNQWGIKWFLCNHFFFSYRNSAENLLGGRGLTSLNLRILTGLTWRCEKLYWNTLGFPLDCDLSDCVMAPRWLQFPEHPLESYIHPEISVKRLSALHEIPPSLFIHLRGPAL